MPEPSAPGRALSSGMAFAVAPTGETVTLEVAKDELRRARGMMGRQEIPRGTGMLFLFAEPGVQLFWMKNCLVPLDMIWLDERGQVIFVEAKAPPCAAEPCPSYGPERPAAAVVELGAGEAARLGIREGVRLLWTEGGRGGGA